MSHLYDQFSDNIFYANTLSGADPDDVKALYVAYHAECVDLSAYTGLNYLSYAFSVIDCAGLALQQELRHFSCSNSSLSKKQGLISLLQANRSLAELTINQLSLPPEDAALISDFAELRYLTVSDTAMTAVPGCWSLLSQLQELTLEAQPLTQLPDELESLAALTALSLKQCRFREVPGVIGQLSTLKTLDLSDNPIRELPESMARLTALEEIDLSGCQLASLPEWLTDLPALKKVNVRNNPFTDLPPALKKLKSKLKIDLKDKALYDSRAREKLMQKSGLVSVFADFGFKLMVIQKLMYEDKTLRPAFDVWEFVKKPENSHMDPESEQACQVMPEVRDYFQKLGIPQHLLADITELCADGGDDIYSQLAPHWSGSEDYFDMHSAQDIRHLPKLKVIESPFLTTSFCDEADAFDVEVIAL